jgi:hypothetical protein
MTEKAGPPFLVSSVKLRRGVAVAVALLWPHFCGAYEADVHFGLTKWLAIQAGFEPWQADSIAIGDQRVDSGDMQYIALLPTYACLAHDKEAAERIGLLHFPAQGRVPAAPNQRAVAAGSEAAQRAVRDIWKSEPSQAVFRLYLMGAALHTLQDSWAHQGAPDVPQPLGPLGACDPTFAWSNPSARGGWNSHKADLAHAWPTDTLAMAQATYSALQRMPAVLGVKRSPKAWATLTPKIAGFLHASTKTEQRKWFAAQGVGDVSFLEGISIPDGAERFDLRWPGRKLPPLSTLQSTQHHIDQDLLDAMSRFFTQWVSTTDFDALAGQMAAPAGAARPAADAQSLDPLPADKAELAARLRAWRIRDHGRIAELAHATQALNAQQRSELSRIAHDPGQLALYKTPAEAYFPLLVNGPEPSPLLGFILYPVKDSTRANARAIAVAKFRHAPYDTVVVLTERIENHWRIVAIRAVVDH